MTNGSEPRIQDLQIQVQMGDAVAVVTARGQGYSPDLVHDMGMRALDLLRQTMIDAQETGFAYVMADLNDDYEDDEED